MTVADYQKNLNKNVSEFLTELQAKFPDVQVTSGFRPRAFTKQGNVSRHARKEAIDIAPTKEIQEYLWNTKDGVSLLNKYGLGILDETSPEMMKKTGATGQHYHIGADSTLVPKAKNRYKELFGYDYGSEPVQEENTPTVQTTMKITTDITNLPKSEEIINFAEETKKIEQQATKEEQDFLREYQSAFTQPVEQQVAVEEPIYEAPQSNLLDIFNSVSQFVDSDVAQQGGKATRQDSLNVYNNSRQVEKVLRTEGYSKTDKSSTSPDNIFNYNDIAYKAYKGDATIRTGNPIKDIFESVDKKEYRKKVDNNKYYQREIEIGVLNPEIPIQLFDKRIQPKSVKGFRNSSAGDVVTMGSYNNIANKPFDLLTEKEKAERVRLYGRQGVPESYSKKQTKPKERVEREQPLKRSEIFKPIEIPDLPKVQAVNLPLIKIDAPVLNIPQNLVKSNIPTSYNIDYNAPNLVGGQMPIESTFLDGREVSAEEMRNIITRKNNYNNYIEEKYGNEEALKNPKAVERLNKLKQSLEITPNYQQEGGEIKLTDNEIAFLSDIAIKDNNGYWDNKNKGKVVQISSPHITMKGVDEKLVGISKETGEVKTMIPGMEYFFKNSQNIIEIPKNNGRK